MTARKIIGVVLGVVLANVFIFGWELVGHGLLFDAVAAAPGDVPATAAAAAMSLPAKLWVVAGWLLGSFLGALLAFRAARWDFAGWIVGAVVAAAGIANITLIPHPLWMALCAVALPFTGAMLAFGIYRRLRATDLNLR